MWRELGPIPYQQTKKYSVNILEAEEDDVKGEEQGPREEELEMEAKILQLSLRSKEGLTSNSSFKVQGKIQQRPVLILIDSGASCNFISHILEEELQLKVGETPRYVKELVTRVSNKGVCKGVKIWVQRMEIVQKKFMIELGGTEMVLGMDWLASLGDIKANFKQLIIKRKGGGKRMTICGDSSLCKDQASWKAMLKAIYDE